MTCQKAHRYLARLKKLPDSQSYPGRHYCAGCAYEQGKEDGEQRAKPNLEFSLIKESQAGPGRHKSVECAYCLGYIDGFKKSKS